MKSKKLLFGIFLALAGFFIIPSVSNAEELTKNFKKEFKVEKGTILRIDNRFGQVNIENWDKNSVLIEVEVTVEHSSKDRAEKMLSSISVTLDQIGNEISGITKVEDNIMKSFANINFNSSSSKELSIDYKVKMPKNLDINLSNKFGDTFIDELTGRSTIEIKYGNLKANRIIYGSEDPLSMLTIGYGNASIDEVDWMRFDIKYANVDIVKSKALVMLSKFSKISVDQASSIVVDSKYDTYTIGAIANIVGESGYTTYRIKSLDKKLDIESKYGDVRIEAVNNLFESISFVGSYSSIYAPISSGISYELDGEASFGSISYNTPTRVSRIESNNKVTVNGRVGENENSDSQVKVRVRFGSAKLK